MISVSLASSDDASFNRAIGGEMSGHILPVRKCMDSQEAKRDRQISYPDDW
jgi:hypothetical protein